MNRTEELYAIGRWTSQRIQLASATLLLYEHAINIADEVEYFWSGPWSISRGIYLCIRYLGSIDVVILILRNCTNLLVTQILYGVQIAVTVLCQAAITIRVWYMFARRSLIRNIAIMAFVAATAASAVLVRTSWPYVRAMALDANTARKSALVWAYVPSLALHSFLFILKVYRFVTSPQHWQRNTFLWRFLKEGMGMYACALGSLLFIVIGLKMTDASQIPVYETALSGGVIFVALTVVSVCRAMLSIKSLAANAHVDPGWLLNHAELSRVHWHQGTAEGEIVVEMPSENSYDLAVIQAC